MSLKVFSALEQNFAEILFYHGFCSPLKMLHLELQVAQTVEEKRSVSKQFIEKYLTKDGQPVNLQDKRISELFDEAMKNMVVTTVQQALKEKQQMEAFVGTMRDEAYSLESFRPKTWKDHAKKRIEKVGVAISETINHSPILKGGVDAAYNGLSRIGVISQKQAVSKEENIVAIEVDEDWDVAETAESFDKRVPSILREWKENPSILLEMKQIKKDIDYLRSLLLPQARPIVEQIFKAEVS